MQQHAKLPCRGNSVPVPSAGGKFYKHFESVVCIFPEKLSGSSVFEDHKVRVRGFDGLRGLLVSGIIGVSRDYWCQFLFR